QYYVVVLPGSYLGRQAPGPDGRPFNPGTGRVLMALVADVQECLQAAQRIVQFIQSKSLKS
ncbi:MAG: succinyldiaminopimelate transaminase, partial [Burkholderiaceae bacterium]